ncbi:hypothetical protein PRIPAC_92397 [Pristionchus pacificus]|uniref:RNase H domain-containing protein n=1 Tax=Pristionchus pacificus TaxID=54126 RepID=A0A2A6BR69_PRIPA|nr:hypothetical protein PRIPAC_92397 [Pristionchus pacificus]|eukprot:PDM68395.1 hypothetical protein PRIPAC_46439 [Pristionchus pacificus]
MSDNSPLAGGQEGTSNVGFSHEAMNLLDLLSPRPTHVTPQLTRTGFSKQAEFNTLVLNKLEEARKDPSVLDSVIEIIKERNSILVLADKNPKLLDALDTAKAIEGASGASSSPLLQAMMIAQALTQVQSQSNDRKRRAASPSSSGGQPFRYRASAFPQAAGAHFTRLPSLAPHFAQYDNRASARRESDFVRNELRRLLSSGAIERAAHPSVISPLSVAHGKKLRLILDLSALNRGYEIDLSEGIVSLSRDRIDSALERLQHLREVESLTVRDRNCAIGCIMAASLVLGDRASLLSRALLHTVAVHQKLSLSSSTSIPLSPSERDEVDRWIRELAYRAVRSFIEKPWHFDVRVETDASAIELGVVVRDTQRGTLNTSRNLTLSEREESSTLREVRAVDFAVRTFEKEWEGMNVLFMGDNQGAVSILRKGSMKPEINEVAQRVEEIRTRIRANFKFHWIPRELNTDADLASREVDRDDWSIQDWVVERAVKRWGSPDIDMFADETNTKCERFVSRVPSRGALAVNAFGDPTLWRDRSLLWCVPPPSLLSQTLAWMRGTRAKGILGLPYWTSHPVFPSLFPSNFTPPFLKDYIMFREGNHIITPSSGTEGPFSRTYLDSPFILLFLDFNFI